MINTKKYFIFRGAFLGAMIMFGCARIVAQEITGKVVDENLAPISSATITLQTVDSTFVDAVISKEDGTFVLPQNIIPFILTIQHIEFKTFQKVFNNRDVGIIKVLSSINTLEEVVISGKKSYVKVENGKFIYDIENLTKNKIVDNAWGVLSRLPGISTKGSSVSLIGVNKVSILIDGKISTLTEEQLYTMLTNMSANKVDKAEIIYNASPEFHSNGAVINLVMKRSNSRSIEGEIATNYTNQYYSYGGANANLRFATPKATLDVMYGLSRKENMEYSNIKSHHTLHNKLYDINQTERISIKGWEHNIRTSLDYRFNDNNSINIAYTASLSPDKESQSHTTGNFQNSLNIKGTDSKMHNISISSRLCSDISLGFDYTHYNSDDEQNLSFYVNEGAKGKIASQSSQIIDKYLLYADKTHILKNGWNIGYGASYAFSYDRDCQFYDVVENVNQTQNTDSKLKEYRTDLYLSTSKQVNNKLHLSSSLKIEYYKIGNYKKWALYPNFSLNYVQNPKHIFQLGLSTDKTYPKYWSMVSSISYVDGYSEIHGSPGIRPATNYNLNATYIYNRKYIASLFYSYTNDYFAQSPYQSTEKLTLIYKNMNWNYMQNTGINIIIPISAGDWFETRFTGVGMYVHQRCDNFYDISFDREKIVAMGYFDNSFIINKNLVFELNANIQSPMIQGTFDMTTMSSVDAGVKWNFIKDKMSLSIYCNDIFNTSSPKLTVNYKGQNLEMDNRFYSRKLYAHLILKLGGFKNRKVQQIDTSRFGH